MSGRVGAVTTDSSIIDADSLVMGDPSIEITGPLVHIDAELARQTQKANKLYNENEELLIEINKLVNRLDRIQHSNTTKVVISLSPIEKSTDQPGFSPELIKKNQEVAKLESKNKAYREKRDALANELAHELASKITGPLVDIDTELARQTQKANKLYNENEELLIEINKLVNRLDRIQHSNTIKVVFSLSPIKESTDQPGFPPELIKKNQEVAKLKSKNKAYREKRDALANELAHELASRTKTIVRRPYYVGGGSASSC